MFICRPPWCECDDHADVDNDFGDGWTYGDGSGCGGTYPESFDEWYYDHRMEPNYGSGDGNFTW